VFNLECEERFAVGCQRLRGEINRWTAAEGHVLKIAASSNLGGQVSISILLHVVGPCQQQTKACARTIYSLLSKLR
jgi:hypothetical protein